MTHGAGATRIDAAMRRARQRRSVSIKTRGVDPRRVDRANSGQRVKPQGQTGRRHCVGGSMPRKTRGIRAKEVACDSRSTVEAGSPVRVAAPGKARRGRRALKGTRTSREASDRSWFKCEATPLVACSHQNRALDRTGGAGGPVVPERAVMGPSAEAQADVGRTSRIPTHSRCAGSANGRPEGGQSQCGRRVLRKVF
jgi:hypothetical protein